MRPRAGSACRCPMATSPLDQPSLKLGLIAGGGGVPALVRDACRAHDRPLFVAALRGFCSDATVEGTEHAWFGIGQVGGILDALREHCVAEVVLCGQVAKPDFTTLMPDWRGLKLLPRMAAAALQGDDALLRLVVSEIEAEGFRLVGVDQIVGELLAPDGQLGRISPDAGDWSDIRIAIAAARAHGAEDLGQAAVVSGGVVVGLEGADGTDALLARMAQHAPARGGVLVKCAKPQQERRVDLPAIGVMTVEAAARAGLRGIAVETGGSLIVDRVATAAAADRLGLYLVGVRP